MSALLLFYGGVKRDPEVEAWLTKPGDALRRIARMWFEEMRGCGADVRELMHDGCPTVCVQDAGFAYVNTFTAHVNVGFFYGAKLDDPGGLLEGTGKHGRHVKLRPGQEVNSDALKKLVASSYQDIRMRLRSQS
jgi:hypothetical protein